MRATLPEAVRMVLTRRAEAALTAEGVARTRLGYDLLVKLKVDELLGQDDLSAPTRDDHQALDTVMAIAGTRRMAEPRTSAVEGEPHGYHPGA
jgi:hypothetical protein